MGNSTLISGAHTTLRLSGFPTLICVPLSLTVYNTVRDATRQEIQDLKRENGELKQLVAELSLEVYRLKKTAIPMPQNGVGTSG